MSSSETLWLEPTDRIAAHEPNVDPVSGIEVVRISLPERATDAGEGELAGYIIDCPRCGQWTILGLGGEVSRGPEGLSVDGRWSCSNSSCDFIGGIRDGRIDGIPARDEEEIDVDGG